ncbi:MAG: ribokinase [Halanaerobiales bacterium]|nr:ribokinase [Halanaerobiales bacterium]
MIAVIGSSNIDIVYEVDHFTEPGETQTALSLNHYYGGKGANQAVAAAKLSNQNILFSTSIGNDSEGKKIKNRFDKFNIKGYFIHGNFHTGQAFIEVNRVGENKIVSNPGANGVHSKALVEKFLKENGEDIDYCLIQNEIPRETIGFALESLKEKEIKIIYDPAAKEKTKIKWLAGIDYLTPNKTEFNYLKEKLNIKEDTLANQALMFKKETGIRNLILKRGSSDIIIVTKDNKLRKVQTFDIEAVDTTGAGDIFNAALAVGLYRGYNLQKACRYASAAAALSVTKKGAQSSIPDQQEIKEMLSKQTF